tara:strand:+ start:8274 stop:8594 length:321 start_codon:yes stop_codon:yes gene_type:complete
MKNTIFTFEELKALSNENPNDSLFAEKIRQLIREKEEYYNMKSKDGWVVEQYNRNRAPEDWIKTREEIPYIYERNPDTGEIFRRIAGDYDNRECINPEINSVPNIK